MLFIKKYGRKIPQTILFLGIIFPIWDNSNDSENIYVPEFHAVNF